MVIITEDCFCDCYTENNLELLKSNFNVNIDNYKGKNYYVLNDYNTYDPKIKYQLQKGTYYLNGIIKLHPLAIFCNKSNNMITYVGDTDKKLTKTIKTNGIERELDFYWGNITLSVNGNFDTGSIHCYNHGYMGGENLFIYKSSIENM